MKNFTLLFAVMATLFFMTGCSEKFKVAAPYKNITVVYGFLDMADTAHYIRIQKAFLDQDKSALTMAKTPDSSFYANIDVRIERRNFSGALYDTFQLYRVDLNLEGYPKQPGVFFQSPNYAYKFNDVLDPNYIYRIVITNLATGEVDSSDAPVINDVDSSIFYVDVFSYAYNKAGMDFSSTFSNRYFEISGTYFPPAAYSFNGSTTPIAISQAIVRFNWTDSDNLTKTMTDHFYDYNVGYVQMSNNQIDFKIKDIDLYAALSAGMGNTPSSSVYRLIGRCDLFVYLSTTDFYNNQQSSLSQGTGLTGSEIEPLYTNIKGANALGLYTAKGMRTHKITITTNTIDSLKVHPLLSKANLVGTSYHQ